jgi:hypothetical protein
MSNLGRQWQQPELSFTVHRGITRKPQKGRWLGMHWSADPQVARRFAGPFGYWNGRRNESAPSASGAKRPPRKRTYKKPREMKA